MVKTAEKQNTKLPRLNNPNYVRLLRGATATALGQLTLMRGGKAPQEVKDWVMPLADEPHADIDARELLQNVMDYEANNSVSATGPEQQYITQLRSALAASMGLCLKESGTGPDGKPILPISKEEIGWMIKSLVDGITGGVSPNLLDFFRDVKPLEAALGF